MDVAVRIEQVDRRPGEVRTPGEAWAGIERLLVARDDRLGDLVLSLPAVAALRATYPRARLALLVHPRNAPLARLVAGVDDVLAPAGGDLARAIAGFAPDLCVCISRGARLALAVRRAGVGHSVGSGRRWWSPLFERRVGESRRAGARHEAEYALSFAHRAGAGAGPWEARIELPPAALAAARAWRRDTGLDRPFALVHPGTGGSCPGWPTERWVELAAALAGSGLPVALSIGPDDACVERAFGGPGGAYARVAQGLVALAAVAREAAVVVGASTGPIHLAAALGTPTLALHAPWPTCGPSRWGPYAANGWAVVPEGAARSRRERKRPGDRALAAVPTALVAGAALDLARGAAPAAGRHAIGP
jgi:ADP-heptose:LPS heptosyltransferase